MRPPAGERGRAVLESKLFWIDSFPGRAHGAASDVTPLATTPGRLRKACSRVRATTVSVEVSSPCQIWCTRTCATALGDLWQSRAQVAIRASACGAVTPNQSISSSVALSRHSPRPVSAVDLISEGSRFVLTSVGVTGSVGIMASPWFLPTRWGGIRLLCNRAIQRPSRYPRPPVANLPVMATNSDRARRSPGPLLRSHSAGGPG